MPSFVIHWSDRRHLGQLWLSHERDVIRSILGGHVYGSIDKIDCYDTDERIADDVTEDMARKVANMAGATDEALLPQAVDFIETHAGLAFARGLRRADPSFAAA